MPPASPRSSCASVGKSSIRARRLLRYYFASCLRLQPSLYTSISALQRRSYRISQTCQLDRYLRRQAAAQAALYQGLISATIYIKRDRATTKKGSRLHVAEDEEDVGRKVADTESLDRAVLSKGVHPTG